MQLPNSAFYATPIGGDASNISMYSDNCSTAELQFLSSNQKDTDGDGVSDFWEVAYGHRPDLSTDFPIINNSTLNSVIFADPGGVHARLQVLPDYNSSSSLSTFLGL